MDKTIGINMIAAELARMTGCTAADAELFLHELFSLAGDGIESEGATTIPGLGEFRAIDGIIHYKPDDELAAEINAPFEAFEAIELPDGFSFDDNEAEAEAAVAVTQSDEVKEEPAPEPEAEAEADEIMTEAEEESEVAPAPEVEETADTVPEQGRRRRRGVAIAAAAAACIVCFAAGYLAGAHYGMSGSNENWNNAIAVTEEPAGETLADMQPVVEPETEPPAVADQEPVIVTDTISATRYLSTMARAHYGQMEYWVYIYEANRDKLGHPDYLEAGTVVVIPPAVESGLTAGDEAKIKEAQMLASQIYSRF